MLPALTIVAATVAHGPWGPQAQAPAAPPRDVPGAPTTAPPDQSPAQGPDSGPRDGAPGSVTRPRIRPTAVGGIRTGAAPEPSEPSGAEPLPSDESNEPAADAPPVAPPAPQARPIAVVPASPPPAPTPAPVPVAAPAWGVPIRLHLPTLALLTMLIPAGVAAAWAIGGRTHRPGEG
jgi:hypothetical protein